ncbi:HutD family protein [Agrobacterium rubi]|uniref:HutD/Ves family protein n=1 Tax=Agrobacterium rubi TaxID=28099 RepID=UPI001571CE8E|nr:HutD family protein [Agrobacterium rubi]NTF09517.1 HutD family protein [Agrobacterium rubi]NTF22424.1 HutD family protein [Agrobacterium rubi]NTF29281.1 HutD family protein [Agrobacterium rubi]
MKILRASDYKRMSWKNGKGETAEIAVFPADASIDDFDCRISMASVVEDGAFSTFENVDRTLVVLSGEGITLSVDGSEAVELRPDSEPHSFAADAPTKATLLGGPITDLNIMTRRGTSDCQVRRQISGPVAASGRGVTLVFALDSCTKDGLQLLASTDCVMLEPGEALVLDRDENASVIVIDMA